MTDQEFQRLLDADPFEPFTVAMPHGWSHDILRPEWGKVTPFGAAEVYGPNGLRAVISLDHVVSITYADTPVIR